MRNIIIRNCKVFLRDRAAVFYSLLSVFIIIGLYVLFLGNVLAQDIEGSRPMMDSWIMAGMLAAGSFTTTLGASGIRVDDAFRQIDKDFRASPLRNIKLAGAYLVSTMTIGMFLSLVTLCLAEGYILLNGGELLSLLAFVKVVGLLFLCVVSSSTMAFFIVGFAKTANAFGGISTVAGTLVGFLAGIYVPIGQMPPFIQTVIKCFPISHGAALLRQVMMEVPMDQLFAGANAGMISKFELEMGVRFTAGGTQMGTFAHVGILLATAIVFFVLISIQLRGKRDS